MPTEPQFGNPVLVAQASGGTLVLPATLVAAGGVMLVWVAGNLIKSITDNQGNTYVQQRSISVSGTVFFLYMATGCAQGSTTVTITFQSSSAETIAAAVPLFETASPYPDALGNGSFNTGASASDSVTTVTVNDAIVMGVITTPPVGFFPSNGTILISNHGNTLAMALIRLNATSAAPYSPSVGLLSSTLWGAMSVAIAGPATAPSLTAVASGVPTSGQAPLTVAFMGAGEGGSPPYTYSWVFGDGGTSTAQNPSHTYTAPGTPTAVLTVTDTVPNNATANVPITVTATSGTLQGIPARIRPQTTGGGSSRRTRVD